MYAPCSTHRIWTQLLTKDFIAMAHRTASYHEIEAGDSGVGMLATSMDGSLIRTSTCFRQDVWCPRCQNPGHLATECGLNNQWCAICQTNKHSTHTCHYSRFIQIGGTRTDYKNGWDKHEIYYCIYGKQMEDQEERIYITANSYDDYRTRLTAGDLTQNSVVTIMTLPMIQMSPSEVHRPW